MVRVGLIGLGIMGRGLAKNILEADFMLTAYDQKPELIAAQVERGATAAQSIADLARHSDVVITCLPSLAAIRDVYLGPGGVAEAGVAQTTAVDCSTSTPGLTQEIGSVLAGRGIDFLDAPMLKTPQAAWDGTLQLPVGGDAAVLARVRPVLEAISEKIIPAGALGAGQTVKLVNNAITIGTLAVVCEAFVVARKLGVDLQSLFEAANETMASSNQLRNIGPRLIKDDHTLSFATDVALKDIAAFANMALEVGALIPMAESARDLLRVTSNAGFGHENNSRVATMLASVAGTRFCQDEPS